MFAWPILITGVILIVVGGIASDVVDSVVPGFLLFIGLVIVIVSLFYGTAADGWFA